VSNRGPNGAACEYFPHEQAVLAHHWSFAVVLASHTPTAAHPIYLRPPHPSCASPRSFVLERRVVTFPLAPFVGCQSTVK
jgi:hypothetical protein